MSFCPLRRTMGALFVLLLGASALTPHCHADDDVMLQAFYWDVPRGAETGTYWYSVIYGQRRLINTYFKGGVWLPAPSKGDSGGYSMGYDPFDHYDLGQYDQKGTIPTRFGTFAQLKNLLSVLTVPRICDIVINHMAGGAKEANSFTGGETFTRFQYPRRVGPGQRDWWKSYHDFHPNGIHRDRSEPYHHEAFFRDVCQNNEYMREEIRHWLAWLNSGALTHNGRPGYTGWRFDFVKGMDPFVVRDILKDPRFRGQWAVGEFWDGNRDLVKNWLLQEDKSAKAFDFPLFYLIARMCNTTNGSFDMRQLRGAGLVGYRSDATDWKHHTVTFVENHDTDKEDSRIVTDKMLAYALVLHGEGQPCVFWKDYFNYRLGDEILPLIKIRRTLLGGTTSVLLADDDAYVAQRNGWGRLPGGVLMLNDHATFTANRRVTTKWRNTRLKDYTGHITGVRRTDANGSVGLSAPRRGYCIWAPVGYTPR